jgi:hypothetical protein
MFRIPVYLSARENKINLIISVLLITLMKRKRIHTDFRERVRRRRRKNNESA